MEELQDKEFLDLIIYEDLEDLKISFYNCINGHISQEQFINKIETLKRNLEELKRVS